ncbi:MAG: thermonuclease family protein [Bacilli bacterium]|nr:thermonuclease family protein [Bacilli bacterium]
MKKSLNLFLLGFAALALCACGGTPSVNPDNSSDGTPADSSVGTQAEWVDYAKQTKLTHDYNGKEFLKDGIGEVTLVTKVDGDTAHFKQKTGDSGTIKGRYNCIDTPESTGMLEPWGHGASEYNGKLLKEAKHIVLSTDKADGQGAPALDSTGGRYLIYVWVTTEEHPVLDDFICVNLALCQEGWSKAKGTSGKEYADAFISASVQAQTKKLHVWSDEQDPDFNYADPVKVTLQDVIDGKDSKGLPYDWNGSKVTFDAYVAAVGPDQGACYVVRDFEKTKSDGTKYTQRYGMYIFTQYIVYSPLQVIGNELEISGTVSEYNGTLQLVDVSYSDYYHEDGDIKILSTGNEDKVQPLTGNAGKFASDEYINTVVSVDLVCTGGYATVNTATTSAYSFTLYCHDKNNPSEELNIRISDSISIKYPDTLTRIKDDIPFFKGEKSIAESTGKGTDTRKVEYISITGGLVKYVTSNGRTTYQVNLCKGTGLTLHMSEK